MRRALVAILLLLSIGCGSEVPVTCLSTSADPIERWREHLEAEAENGYSGSVLIAEGDTILLEHEVGAAAADDRPTAFWIASISKAVTAVAVMRLVEEGRLDLEAPLGRYLDPVPARWAETTVHDLLTHRSGLPHEYAADGAIDRDAAVAAVLAHEPVQERGEFEYSNDGYNLLAVLVEVASGEPFEAYVRRVVMDPTGMESAGFWGAEPDPSHVAPPRRPAGTSGMPATIWRDGRAVANWGYRGATGIYATPRDLYRFVRALEAGAILAPETFALMLESKNPALGADATTYGYGWALRFEQGQRVRYWHGGDEDWLGHNGILQIEGERIVVILGNAGAVSSGNWTSRIGAGLRACGVDSAA